MGWGPGTPWRRWTPWWWWESARLEHSWERGQKLYYRSGSHLARLGSPTNGMETGDTMAAVDTLAGVRKCMVGIVMRQGSKVVLRVGVPSRTIREPHGQDGDRGHLGGVGPEGDPMFLFQFWHLQVTPFENI